MNKESNGYIITFSIIMVVVMGVMLALVAQFTKPFQDNNVKQEKMQNILSSVNITVSRAESEEAYKKYIVESYVYNANGEIQEGQNAFDINLASELKKPEDQQVYPLFICDKDGERFYIVPMRGKGLWDAIWGYVSFNADGKTIAGTTFDHKGETPGLGAEIAQKPFQLQFVGKSIVDEAGNFKSIGVVKAGKIPSGSPEANYNVDAISGGTMTSNGVNDMLRKYFQAFVNYMQKNGNITTEEVAVQLPDSILVDSLTTDTAAVLTDSIH